jgi:hypothetical protein
MVLKAQALAFLLSFFATQAVANTSSGLAARADINKGNAYLYECGNCKCDDSWQNEGFQGDTGCVANIFGSSARAIGLTADNHYLGQKGTTCALFTSGDCSGQVVSLTLVTLRPTFTNI